MRKPPPTTARRLMVWFLTIFVFSVGASILRQLMGLELKPIEMMLHTFILVLEGYLLCFIIHVWNQPPSNFALLLNEMRRNFDQGRAETMKANVQLDQSVTELEQSIADWEDDEEDEWWEDDDDDDDDDDDEDWGDEDDYDDDEFWDDDDEDEEYSAEYSMDDEDDEWRISTGRDRED